jgi:hypothetical protein
MRLLALDLGTTTGYALLDGQAIISGSMSFKPQRFEGGGMRYLRFKRWLDDVNDPGFGKQNGKITEIVFEEVRAHKGNAAAHAYGGFLASLTTWCEERNIPYTAVPVSHIKKFATGKGNAGKPAMIEAVTPWGYKPVDDNEADAIALLHLKMSELGVGPATGTPKCVIVSRSTINEMLG